MRSRRANCTGKDTDEPLLSFYCVLETGGFVSLTSQATQQRGYYFPRVNVRTLTFKDWPKLAWRGRGGASLAQSL